MSLRKPSLSLVLHLYLPWLSSLPNLHTDSVIPFSICLPSMDSPGSPFQFPPVVLNFPRHFMLNSIVFNHRYTLMSEHFPSLFHDHRLQNQEGNGKEAHSLRMLPIFLYLTAPYGVLLALQRLVIRITS